MPLPVSIDQPVHIHGLFSLPPDRGKLLTLEDKTRQDKSPAEWNEWLLRNPIPITWAKLLGSLACNEPTGSIFNSISKFLGSRHTIPRSVDIFNAWPRKSNNSSDPHFSNTLADVVGVIREHKLRVWPTNDGYVSETHYLMRAETTSSQLRDAISEATGQIVLAPSRLISSFRALFRYHVDRQIVEQIIIPKWNEAGAANWSTASKAQLASFVLAEFSSLNAQSKTTLRNTPFIQLSSVGGTETTKFAAPAELIDSANQNLVALFFPEEEVLPLETIFERFSAELRNCGLKTKLDRSLLSSRIRYYSKQSQTIRDLESRLQKLFSLPCPGNQPMAEISELRDIPWIPVMKGKNVVLTAPNGCRGRNDELLVGSQMPIYKRWLSSEWMTFLGWKEGLPSQVLVSQLRHGIERQNQKIVNAVLHYMADKKQPFQWKEDLQNVPFILANGDFVTTEHVFSPAKSIKLSCDRLAPYLANVEKGFWNEHEEILKSFNICERPNVDDLLALLDALYQKTIEQKAPLDTFDVAVAVEALRLVSLEPRDLLQGIKVPNTEGYLCSIDKICWQDRSDLNLSEMPDITHRDIPPSTIRALKIESLNEWVVSGILNVEEDDELFDQHEETTTRIADTLRRYSIESTFREYLAK